MNNEEFKKKYLELGKGFILGGFNYKGTTYLTEYN